MHKHHTLLYRSSTHILITFLFLLVPFAFFVVFSLFTHISLSALLVDVWVSLVRLFVAYVIALLLGWGLAVIFARGKSATIALPAFDVLQSLPTFALLPFASLAWGPTNTTVIFFLVLAIVWPIFFSIVSSMKLVKREWEEVVTITQLRGVPYLRHFLFPVTIPGAMTGTVIGLGEGWEALVATEIIAHTQRGLGQFFQTFSVNSFVTTLGVLGLLLLVFTINKLVWLPLLDWSHHRMEE